MNQLLLKLTERDIFLYQDICESNDIVPCLVSLTSKQIHILISLRQNGLIPEYPSEGIRYWRLQKKGKQGGRLTQKTAQKFFLSET